MSSNVPAVPLFSTLPAVPADDLLMSTAEMRDRLALLDAGGDLGVTERERWQRAAADGQWTAEELLAAVLWLNVHHDGYVKIASVHRQIEGQRKTLRLARAFCWQHPVAVEVLSEVLGEPLTAADVECFWKDYRRKWLADIADRVMAKLSNAEWKRWAIENDRNFRSEL
jgi:hypothetical protein